MIHLLSTLGSLILCQVFSISFLLTSFLSRFLWYLTSLFLINILSSNTFHRWCMCSLIYTCLSHYIYSLISLNLTKPIIFFSSRSIHWCVHSFVITWVPCVSVSPWPRKEQNKKKSRHIHPHLHCCNEMYETSQEMQKNAERSRSNFFSFLCVTVEIFYFYCHSLSHLMFFRFDLSLPLHLIWCVNNFYSLPCLLVNISCSCVIYATHQLHWIVQVDMHSRVGVIEWQVSLSRHRVSFSLDR